jgi:hypothetical protein
LEVVESAVRRERALREAVKLQAAWVSGESNTARQGDPALFYNSDATLDIARAFEEYLKNG